MGAWGTGLFTDDTASDVREDFRTRIGDGLTAEEATAALLKTWRSTVEDPEEGPTFWLALASTQWSLGRLVPVWRYRYPNGREIAQFMIGATSGREFPAGRLRETGLVLRPSQKPGGYMVALWRTLDRELARLFGLGQNAA